MLGLRDGSIAYRCLDATQLLKHLLGADDALRDGRLPAPSRLVVVFWQPTAVGPYGALFRQLAAELDDFASRVADQPIEVGRMSTATLLDEWSDQGVPRWLRNHADELRRRYDVELIAEATDVSN